MLPGSFGFSPCHISGCPCRQWKNVVDWVLRQILPFGVGNTWDRCPQIGQIGQHKISIGINWQLLLNIVFKRFLGKNIIIHFCNCYVFTWPHPHPSCMSQPPMYNQSTSQAQLHPVTHLALEPSIWPLEWVLKSETIFALSLQGDKLAQLPNRLHQRTFKCIS